MSRWILPGALVLIALAFVALPARAGPNRNARILIHVSRWHGPKNLWAEPSAYTVCDDRNPATNPTCGGILTSGDLYPPGLYPYATILVRDADPIAGVGSVEFGIDYRAADGDGVDIFGGIFCGWDVTRFPGSNGNWPAAGSGLRMTWDPTQPCPRFEPGGAGTGVGAIVGYLYVGAYSPDTLRVTVNPGSGLARVGSCAAELDTIAGGPAPPAIDPLGTAVFSRGGTAPGYNPCGLVVPVRAATWGSIKTLMR